MKKIIAAAAGLMLAGTMASVAVAQEAGITFKGDARARFYAQEEYASSESTDTHWNSRVRLQWKATSKGGAYAIGRFRLADATWDGTQQTAAGGEKSNLKVDKAYIGVPFGPVTVEAGLMYRSWTPFSVLDVLRDSLVVKYQEGNTNLLAYFDMVDEFVEDAEGAKAPEDRENDDDIQSYGFWLGQKFTDSLDMVLAGQYTSDDQGDKEGFAGTIQLNGNMGVAAITGELAYKEGDLTGNPDDGIGGFVSVTAPAGAASLTGVLGFTADGYVADGDFGPFIMLSDYSQIATGTLIGSGGDTFFAAFAGDFKATERLTLGGVLAYADVDANDDDESDEKAFEIGATAAYAVTDGAKLKGVIGYLDFDEADYNPFGFGLSLEISY
jgi:hypothetical protein